MSKVLEAITFALSVPVVAIIALFFALVTSLQCWFEAKRHHTNYNECICEKDPLGCEDYLYGR